MNENPRTQPESVDDKLEKSFINYMEERSITADELREAYYRLCGISEAGEPDERIANLVKEMDRMTEERYPLNRFVKMITGMEEWEDSGIHLSHYLDSLPITDKERSMITSIVTEGRVGELLCRVNDAPIAKFLITKHNSGPGMAYAMRARLQEALAETDLNTVSDLSFWFEEQ